MECFNDLLEIEIFILLNFVYSTCGRTKRAASLYITNINILGNLSGIDYAIKNVPNAVRGISTNLCSFVWELHSMYIYKWGGGEVLVA